MCARTRALRVHTRGPLSHDSGPAPAGVFLALPSPAFPELSLLCFVISAAWVFENESHYRNDSWQPSRIPFCFEMDDTELLALKGTAQGAPTPGPSPAPKHSAGGFILSPKTVLNFWASTGAVCALRVNWKMPFRNLIMS